MAVGRSAALKIDWSKIATQLGLKGATASGLSAFKQRSDDARRRVTELSNEPQTVDFAHYRTILKNQAVIDEVEKKFSDFRPATYDVSRQLKAIDAFRAQAVQSAEETKASVDKELGDLRTALKNIEETRPLEDLTVEDFFKAVPELERRVESCVKRGIWDVPGYNEKFGDHAAI